jgi:hypothetical protein
MVAAAAERRHRSGMQAKSLHRAAEAAVLALLLLYLVGAVWWRSASGSRSPTSSEPTRHTPR